MAAAFSSKLFFSSPIIVILGATGTGKSKLAIELAKKFNGEVINADAMQMYKGLDIATNKVTEKEKQGISHHLLGFLDPNKKLTVCEFRDCALDTIKDIISRQKLPIIVGGTNYYIESILYKILMKSSDSDVSVLNNVSDGYESSSEDENFPRKKPKWDETKNIMAEYDKLDNEKLHQKLQEIDPDSAKVTHPNDRRKVLRCIEVYYQYGETNSSLLKKQRSLPGGSKTGGPLRFTKSLMFWLQCEIETLNSRLYDRVDAMISQGLIDELLEFKEKCTRESFLNDQSPDYNYGILQSIGFKEFHEYLKLDTEQRDTEEGKKLLEKGIELLKIATRQYARRQRQWVQNRFLKNISRQVPPIYGLDVNDVSKWTENVYEVAEKIVEAHLRNEKPPYDPLPVTEGRVFIDQNYKCDICDRVLMGAAQWKEHIKGQKHKKVLKKRKEMEKEAEKNSNSENTTKEEDTEVKIKN